MKGNHHNATLCGTIDLHGFRKAEAVARLTAFLDQIGRKHNKRKEVWVQVITGKGSHGQHGPVLRNAIQALFEKRKMKYSLNRDKGSFIVNVNSGHVLFAPELPTDTKVVLKDVPIPVPSLPKITKGTREIQSSQEVMLEPTPLEVSTHDKAVEESLKDRQELLSTQKKEEVLLRKVLSESALQAKQEEEEDALQYVKALSISTMENQFDEFAMANEKAIQESLQEQEYVIAQRRAEEAMVEKAMLESLFNDAQGIGGDIQKLGCAFPIPTLENHPGDGDVLQKALELPESEFQTEEHDAELQRVLELSQIVVCREDEDLMRILELSQRAESHLLPPN